MMREGCRRRLEWPVYDPLLHLREIYPLPDSAVVLCLHKGPLSETELVYSHTLEKHFLFILLERLCKKDNIGFFDMAKNEQV